MSEEDLTRLVRVAADWENYEEAARSRAGTPGQLAYLESLIQGAMACRKTAPR